MPDIISGMNFSPFGFNLQVFAADRTPVQLIQIDIAPNPNLKDPLVVESVMREIVTKDPYFGGDFTRVSTYAVRSGFKYLLSDGRSTVSFKAIANAWQCELAKIDRPDITWHEATRQYSQKDALKHIVENICGEKIEKPRDISNLIRIDIPPNPDLADADMVRKIFHEIVTKDNFFGGDYAKINTNESVVDKAYPNKCSGKSRSK